MPKCPPGTHQYIIQPGDNFWRLSQRHGVSHADIVALNPGIDPFNLRVGQVICIPAASLRPPVPYPYQGYWDHVIAPGDTIWGLSKHYHISYQEILHHNPGIHHTNLRPGQIIHIPHH